MKPTCNNCGDRIHFKGYDKFGDKIYYCRTCEEYKRENGNSTPYEPRPIERNLIDIYKYRMKQ